MKQLLVSLAWLVSFAGCWEDSEAAAHGNPQQVGKLFDDYYASLDRQCEIVRTCYPSLQADDGLCWGPIPGGGYFQRVGWPEASAEAREAGTACLEKVYARTLASVAMAYSECMSRAFAARESCLSECPDDVTTCLLDETSEEQCDEKIGLTSEGSVSRVCGL